MSREFDVSIRRAGSKEHGTAVVSIPAYFGVPLMEAGFWRAKVTMTDAGILIRPYKAALSTQVHKDRAVLPEAWE